MTKLMSGVVFPRAPVCALDVGLALMPCTALPTLVFDMDGVLFESVHRKLLAMLAVFPESDRVRLEPVVLSLSGVPRLAKLRHVFTSAYGRAPKKNELEVALDNYERNLGQFAEQPAPLVKGIASFLQSIETQSYVASSAPQAEVFRQLSQAGLIHHFSGVFGSPTTKTEALREVRRRHPSGSIVFFGDARADQVAANSVGTAFVGVSAESNQFPDKEVTTIPHFENIAVVDAAIRLVLCKSMS